MQGAKNETELLTGLISSYLEEEIPEQISRFAKTCILDYLGVAFAGARSLKERHESFLRAAHMESGAAAVIGCQAKASAQDAALLNGMSAHFLELDDGNRFGMVHPGAPVLSALFAGAKLFPMSAEDFIRGVVVGYEVTIRLAASIQPAHKKMGFHATGTCGCIGAAAALCAAWKLDTVSVQNVLSAAIASVAGLLEMIEDTSQLKPFNAGNAARNAVTAALIGQCGYTGPIDPLGGGRGFLKNMTGGMDANCLRRDGGQKYVIGSIYRKPYAFCRHCHSALEAALLLREERGVSAEQIERVGVYTYGLAVFGHDHTEVTGCASAKMSIPFAVADALVLGERGAQMVEEQAVEDERILSLAKKVLVYEDPVYSAQCPNKRMARVTVQYRNGCEHTKEVAYPKGEPENPLSEQELFAKYRRMMDLAGLPEDRSRHIAECVMDLETSLDELLSLI